MQADRLYLVEDAIHAKKAWLGLSANYQPTNAFRASTLENDIICYRCAPDMDVKHWLDDMQHLYYSLCEMNKDCLCYERRILYRARSSLPIILVRGELL